MSKKFFISSLIVSSLTATAAAPINKDHTQKAPETSESKVETHSIQSEQNKVQAFIGYKNQSTKKNNDEIKEMNGVSLGAGYEMPLQKEGLSTTTKLTYTFLTKHKDYFSSINGDFYQNTLIASQSLNFYVVPQVALFAELGLGLSRFSLEASSGGFQLEGSAVSFVSEWAMGTNIKLSNGVMPFARLAYQNNNVNDVKIKSKSARNYKDRISNVDLSGANIMFGVGYQF